VCVLTRLTLLLPPRPQCSSRRPPLMPPPPLQQPQLAAPRRPLLTSQRELLLHCSEPPITPRLQAAARRGGAAAARSAPSRSSGSPLRPSACWRPSPWISRWSSTPCCRCSSPRPWRSGPGAWHGASRGCLQVPLRAPAAPSVAAHPRLKPSPSPPLLSIPL
jgi:hypothetical protein